MNQRTGDPLLTLSQSSLGPRSGASEGSYQTFTRGCPRPPARSGPPAGEVASLRQRLFHPFRLDIQGLS